ncbi:hypothetical protein [Mangrovicella endophytica]|uniref:hypothetical protein n=1 Tax=Mangrovicella endophytica TaxID=2066697 RepID=UPI000C9DB0C9|nr:hypothetical protein [Mangrovicella endophytica]
MIRPVLIAAGLMIPSAPALAEDLTFTLENHSSVAVTEFYVSPVSVEDWEENLVTGGLQPGEGGQVTIADGRAVCEYDIRTVYADGDETVDRGVNLCELGTYTVSDGSPDPVVDGA